MCVVSRAELRQQQQCVLCQQQRQRQQQQCHQLKRRRALILQQAVKVVRLRNQSIVKGTHIHISFLRDEYVSVRGNPNAPCIVQIDGLHLMDLPQLSIISAAFKMAARQARAQSSISNVYEQSRKTSSAVRTAQSKAGSKQTKTHRSIHRHRTDLHTRQFIRLGEKVLQWRRLEGKHTDFPCKYAV